MPLTVHKIDGSPPVRAVLMTLDLLGLKPTFVEVNTLAGETKTPEFLAKNPMHTVPLLEDGDFILSDSHAIITYLVSKYGAEKREELYSSGFALRATIDQRLYFDAANLFPKFIAIIVHILREGGNGPTPQHAADTEETYGILEKYLETSQFIAHDRLTLADISIVATVSTLDIFVPVTDKFPKLEDWFSRMKETEFYQKANVPGLEQIKGLLKMKLEGKYLKIITSLVSAVVNKISEKMPLTLYKTDGSPPARAVLMTLDILGLQPTFVEVMPLRGETKTPEFLSKNPMHTIPLLEDGDFTLSDSHAIITYLVSKYGAEKREELYSSDFALRATINQRLYLDAANLFPKFMAIMIHIFRDGGNGPTPQQAADIEENYGILEKYLEKSQFIAHDRLTLADISIVATVSTLDIFVPVTDKFPKLEEWFSRMKKTEFYQKANEPGLQQIKGFLKTKLEGSA